MAAEVSGLAGEPANIFEAARRGWDFRPRARSAPCEELPGSPAKVEVLRRRLEAGVELWSDGDNDGGEA